jgi:hypothetical protein
MTDVFSINAVLFPVFLDHILTTLCDTTDDICENRRARTYRLVVVALQLAGSMPPRVRKHLPKERLMIIHLSVPRNL